MTLLIAAFSLFAPAPQIAVCAFDPVRGVLRNAGLATPQYEATSQPWSRSGEDLTINGATYTRDGAPVTRVGINFAAIAVRDGIPIFAKGSRDELKVAGEGPTDAIYLLLGSHNCLVQPYVRVRR